jgi:hypothetical protein
VKNLFATDLRLFSDCFITGSWQGGVRCSGGRHETHSISTIRLIPGMGSRLAGTLAQWDGVKTLIKVTRRVDARMVKGVWVEATVDDKYCITSLDASDDFLL